MGTGVEKEEFCDSDYSRFRDRLEECLSVLARLLERPCFGMGPVTVGAEAELFLIDGSARPLPRNQVIRAAAADGRITLELNRFNLELNASPVLLAGRPFSVLEDELDLLLNRVSGAASDYSGRPALVGILPTLGLADLGPGMLTDAARYRALSSGLRRLRRDPFRIRISGQDPLELASADIGLEAANSSFQIHLRVVPADFTRTYNAVQLATAPVLAVSGNSPTLLGHRLWEETRIALFKQSVDGRRAGGPHRTARTALARAGCAAGRWSCSPRASGCTSRCCRCSAARTRPLAASTRQSAVLAGIRRRCTSSGCIRAPSGPGTGPSTIPRRAGICGSRCGPCPPAPP